MNPPRFDGLRLDPVVTKGLTVNRSDKKRGRAMGRKIAVTMLFIVAFLMIFAGFNPRKVDVTESVVVNAPRADIWQAVTDFEGTFHRSNDAHILTEVTSRQGTGFVDGLRFFQVETVGGIKGVLDGRVYDVFPPTRYRWSAETTYSLWGLDIVDVFEGGDLRIEKTGSEKGWRLSHRVYGVFPDSFKGRALSWFMSAFMDIESDAARHTRVELEYVKKKLEQR